MTTKRALAACAALLFSPLLFAAENLQIPTQIVTNARIFTSNAAQPYAEAVALLDDKILAVGTNEEILKLAKKQTFRFDAGGRRLIAGLNDAHVHLGWNALPAVKIERDMDPSWDEIATAIREATAKTPATRWIDVTIGPKILLDRTLTLAAVDEVCGKHMVKLTVWTGHGMILSKAARAALGLTSTATDPPGGWYGRDAQGNFDGRIYEYAQYPLNRKYAELASDADLSRELRAFATEAINYGITSFQVMCGVNPERYRKIIEKAHVPQRVRRIDFIVDPLSTERSHGNGMKFVLDGTPVEKNAAMRKPYPGGGRGRENFSDITPLIQRAVAGRQQILLHAVGDKTIADALKALAKFPSLRRPRIEHGDGLQKDLYKLARKTGVTIVQNPSHFAVRSAFPKGRYQPMASLFANKIPVAIGSDGPVNPFLNIMFATSRPDDPKEALTREQAVIAYTHGSAWAEMRENEKGMILKGMLADMVILDRDILDKEVKPEELPGVHSYMTIINGVLVSKSPELK